MAKTLLNTLADLLAKLQAKTIGKTLSDVEGKALLDTLANTLLEVRTMSHGENWVMRRPTNTSKRRLPN